MPNLTLVANLGLVLFLFIVGLEVDLRFLFSNWKVALNVGVAGMLLPFGLGCGIAWGLYKDFPAQIPISFGVFMLFVGVAMAITVSGYSQALDHILSAKPYSGFPRAMPYFD
jgi:Kef-type K+ transport system membrane component KefB